MTLSKEGIGFVNAVTPAAVDFTSPPDTQLQSLSGYIQALKDIRDGLELYLSTVHRGQSLAASRGKVLSASHLSRQLGRLFTTEVPDIIEGPRVDWAQIVTSRQPLRDLGDDTYSLGDSTIRISKVDMDLIATGRPQQFLTPWPPVSDITMETEALDMVAGEITDFMRELPPVSSIGAQLQRLLQHRRHRLRRCVEMPNHLSSSFAPRPLSPVLPEHGPSADMNDGNLEDVFVPDSPGYPASLVLHDTTARDNHDDVVVASDTVDACRPLTRYLPESAVAETPRENDMITHQPCDHCRKNNKKCRLKPSGTCFNCAERKKRCRRSLQKSLIKEVESISERAGVASNETSGQPQTLVSSVRHVSTKLLPAPGRVTSLPPAGSDYSAAPGCGLGGSEFSESAAILLSPREPRTARPPTEAGSSPASTMASTVEDRFELPPSRTVRSSSLVRRRGAEVAWERESPKRQRVANSR